MSLIQKAFKRMGLATQDDLRGAYKAGRKSMARSFAGAAVNRLTQDWVSSVTSIQADIRGSIVTLRERARDLSKNNPLVQRWLNLCAVNIVGPYGFTLQMDVREFVENKETKKTKLVPDKIANTKIEEAFREWTKPENCSVNGRMSFRQICRLVVINKKRDGEALIYKVRNRSRFGFQLHVIAPEMLDEAKNEVRDNGNVVIMGVEMDKWRRPVAYYFKKLDPYLELYGSVGHSPGHTVIPADRIIHVFRSDFENQTRGVTELASAMLMLKHLSGYDEATVVNARVSAAKGIYFKTDPAEPGEYAGDDEDAEGNIVSTMEPGVGEQLPPGVEPFLVDPKYPAEQYGDYQKAVQKKLSAGLGVAFSSLSNDLSEGSYGSNRVGLIDERSLWQVEQQDFIENVLMNLFPEWLDMALLKVLNLPSEKLDKFNRPNWVGRTWDWIDPLNDATARAVELAMGMNSPWKIAGERGMDPIEMLEELSEWYAKAKELNVPLQLGNITINVGMPAQKPAGKSGSKPDDTEKVEEDEERLLALPKNGNGHAHGMS